MDKNALSSSEYLLFLIIQILMLLLSKPVIASDFLSKDCSPWSNYNINTTFETNLKLLLQILTSKTPLTGFYNISIGDFPDKIHGQALCRGDINASTCQNCVKTAGEELEKICKSKDAVIWYESCQVRYSYRMFFSTQDNSGKYVDWATQKQNVSNPVQFSEVLMYLLKNISNKAAFDASKQMFSTGEIIFSGKPIFGLVQCTKDINGGECFSCLNQAFGDLKGCCYSSQGGIIVSRNCNVRYELYRFYNSSANLLTYPSSKGHEWEVWMILLLVCVPMVILAVLIGSWIFFHCRERKQIEDGEKSQITLLQELATPKGISVTETCDLMNSKELPFFDLVTLEAATNNFSVSNKLGQGGFGTVFKGVLPDGKEIAVKRLSGKSMQGLEEFKNEIILISKLQHKNLLRLLGCGLEEDEKLLIYEFMHNKSLDAFIFDSNRRAKLDWKTFYNIISGIARGLLYLHEDSRLKIIHRDLKPSNVLLDQEMVAKISDFGMARIFGETQNTANTKRIAGTYGYMAPEYAMEGLFSVKSDVFSFGVIVLEFLSGKQNSGFYITGLAPTLVAYAWKLWNEGKLLEFIDPLLMEKSPTEEIIRCMHIGLLCVQEDPEDRPTMSSIVVVLLGSEKIVLPEPNKPAFSAGKMVPSSVPLATDPPLNQFTDSIISPQ